MKDRAAIGFSAEFTIAEQQDKFEVNIKFLFVIFASFLNTNFALIRSLFFLLLFFKKDDGSGDCRAIYEYVCYGVALISS